MFSFYSVYKWTCGWEQRKELRVPVLVFWVRLDLIGFLIGDLVGIADRRKECQRVEIHIGVTDAGARFRSRGEMWPALTVTEVLCKN